MPPQQGMAPQNAAAMAALVDSLNGWTLGGGQQQGPQGYAGGPAGPGMQPHRAASFDSALAAHQHHQYMVAQQQAQQQQQHGGHQVGGRALQGCAGRCGLGARAGARGPARLPCCLPACLPRRSVGACLRRGPCS